MLRRDEDIAFPIPPLALGRRSFDMVRSDALTGKHVKTSYAIL